MASDFDWGNMTTKYHVIQRGVLLGLVAGAMLVLAAGNANAAEPSAVRLQSKLGPTASAQLRGAAARCETGETAACWTIAASFFHAAQTNASSATCALVNCNDRAAAYNELGCGLAHHACDGGEAEACAAARDNCPDGLGRSLLASMTSPSDSSGSRLSDSWRQLAEEQADPEERPNASPTPPATSIAGVSPQAARQPQASTAQAAPATPRTASATIGDEGVAVVVAWSDAEAGPDSLDAQLVSSVIAQGFRVVARPLRMAPALFLQQERPDCDPWYLRELILELDADLAVCASQRQGQLNLTAASLRRDVTRYITLGGAEGLQVVAGQLAAISLPEIVRPSAGFSVVADLEAAYNGFPTVSLELPVADRLSLAVRAGYQDTDVEPTPYLMLGLQARLYFNDYQDGVFVGLHVDWASASYADELVAQSVNTVTPGLSVGYRLDLPFHITVTPKVEGLLVNQRTMTDTVVSVGKTSAWADAEADGRATIEVGFKF